MFAGGLRCRTLADCAEPPPNVRGRIWGRSCLHVCGGTEQQTYGPQEPAGLSPRVRRYPFCRSDPDAPLRSISACAEVPPRIFGAESRSGVYLRVCGGTPLPPPRLETNAGLSPRVRRYHQNTAVRLKGLGSISACAEVPVGSRRRPRFLRVYLRVCGGTHATNCRNGGQNEEIRMYSGVSPATLSSQWEQGAPRSTPLPDCWSASPVEHTGTDRSRNSTIGRPSVRLLNPKPVGPGGLEPPTDRL